MTDKHRSYSQDSSCSTRAESRADSIDSTGYSYRFDSTLDCDRAYALDSAQAKAFAPALAEAHSKQARSVSIPQRITQETQIRTRAEYFPQWLVPALKPFWLFSQAKVLFDGSNETEHQMNLAYVKSQHMSSGSKDTPRSSSSFSNAASSCSTRASTARDDASTGANAHCYDSAKAKVLAAASLPQVCSKEQLEPIAGQHKAAGWLVPALKPFWFFSDERILFNGENEIENQMDLAYGK